MKRSRLGWMILAVLAAGLGLYLLAPALSATALPYLLWAACPIVMLVMMKGMQGSRTQREERLAPRTDDIGPTREDRLARLREQQVALADRIDALEQEEPQAPSDGRH